MKVKEFNWKFMIIVGMLFSVLINGFIILLAAFIYKGGFSDCGVNEAVDYAIRFSLCSPLLVAVISGIVVYRHSNKHKFYQSLVAAVLTAIISFTILATVTSPYAKEFYDEYEHKVHPITGE